MTYEKLFERLKTNYKTAASKVNLLKTDVISNYESYFQGELSPESLDKNILNLYKSANALGLKEIITTTQLDGMKDLENSKKFINFINEDLIKEDFTLSNLPNYIEHQKELINNPALYDAFEKIFYFEDYVTNPFKIDIGELEENIENYLKIDTEFEKGDINLTNIDFNLDEIPEKYAKFTQELKDELENLETEKSKLADSWRPLSRNRHQQNIIKAKNKIKTILQSEDVNFENLKNEFAGFKEFKNTRRTLDDVAKDIANYLEKNNLTLKDVKNELKTEAEGAESKQLLIKIKEILKSRENMYSLIAKGLENTTKEELQLAVGHAAVQGKDVIEQEVQEYLQFLMQDTNVENLPTYKDIVKGSIDFADISNLKNLLQDFREELEFKLGINMKNVFRYLPKILKERIQMNDPKLAEELLNVAKEV